MSHGLVIAGVERAGDHGAAPGLVAIVLVAIAVVGALVYLVKRRTSDRDPAGDRGREASQRSLVGAIVPAAAISVGGRPRTVAAPTEALPRDPVVSVSSLTKRYGELVAVDQVSFSLEAGTVTGFLGPNGAGKTTTLRVLLGLAHPTGGEALVFGRRYHELDFPARRVGAVLESNDFHPGRSGRDHLRALALAAEIPPDRVEEVLDVVELEAAAGRRVKTYSLGMRQRLGLAAALLGDPELLILDEPANGLDPAGVHWLRGFLRRFAGEGRTVLVSSHVLAEVAQTVDRIVIIDRGRLLTAGTLADLTERGQTLEDVYLDLTAGAAS